MNLWMQRAGFFRALAGALLALLVLNGCVESERADGRVPVAIHGVNHTGEEFRFVLVDPEDKENIAGGETINAFGAGGTMCCFHLPKQWRPGLQAEVRVTTWLPPTPTDALPSVRKSYVLPIPSYEQGKAPELWILRTGDDEFDLVASNLQPDHPQWPGKIKGWPVPSVEYRRMIHAQYLQEAQSDIDLAERSLAELKNRPLEHGKEMWEHRGVRQANALKAFKGPGDAAFLASLHAEYQAGLAEARERLQRVKASRP